MIEDEYDDNIEYCINPEKKKEIVQKIVVLLHKKDKTEQEHIDLHIYCRLLLGMSPKKVRKIIKFIEKRIPGDVDESDRDQLGYEIQRIIDKKVVQISKDD